MKKYTLTGEVYYVNIYCTVHNTFIHDIHWRCEMSITSDLIRGHTDTIILAQLIDKDNYGYEINKSIMQKTGGKYELKEATLYTAFRRLEQAGFIVSYWGDEQVGARRKYYSITDFGRDLHESLLKDWESVKEMIDNLIERK